MKALGTGHTQEVLWRNVEVVRHGGPPQLLLHGGAARRFEAMGGATSLLTITHSETLALAQVLLLGALTTAGCPSGAPARPLPPPIVRPPPHIIRPSEPSQLTASALHAAHRHRPP